MKVDIPMEIRPGDLRCPTCFHRDIVHSLRRGIIDAIMFRFGREPRHCRGCGRRFYVKANGRGTSRTAS